MKLQAEFDAPIWHVMALMVEFDLTKTWNAFMQVSGCHTQLSSTDFSMCSHKTPEKSILMAVPAGAHLPSSYMISPPCTELKQTCLAEQHCVLHCAGHNNFVCRPAAADLHLWRTLDAFLSFRCHCQGRGLRYWPGKIRLLKALLYGSLV